MEITLRFSPEDIVYVEQHFMCLAKRPETGPGPSYVLSDGREFYPHDYFEQEMDEARFKDRLLAEMRVQGGASLDPDKTWQSYLSGVYAVCLRSATPENIVRKDVLLARIESLTSAPLPESAEWMQALKEAVDALDLLERPFSPHYDRARFGRPPTRDSHIGDVRARFLQEAQR